MVTCPLSVTVSSLVSNVGNVASWAPPTCTDLDQNDNTLTTSCNPVSGFFFSGVGSNSVTCTCTDNGGLSDTCVFTVTVEGKNRCLTIYLFRCGERHSVISLLIAHSRGHMHQDRQCFPRRANIADFSKEGVKL